MLFVLFAMIVFFFMLVGAGAFILCVLIPSTRRYALSVALWIATWGPCSVAFMTLTGLAFVAGAFISKSGDVQRLHLPGLVSVFGWGSLIAGTVSTAIVATVVAWLHQFVVRRFTFALFRLYATAVVAGIGSVFGWSLSWWMLSLEVPHVWAWSLLSIALLVVWFGAAAYRGARGLRGEAPRSLTWVLPEEFDG